MFILFVLLAIVFSVVACYCIMEGYASFGASSAVAALLFFILTIAVHFNNIEVGKVEALRSAGIEPLSTQQVYTMSRKELDECKIIYTFSKTYYFAEED